MSDKRIQVVVPMAGKGTRFVEAGYELPKPLLLVHDHPMYEVVLANMLTEQVERVVLIAQKSWELSARIAELTERVPASLHLIEIEYVTEGPAATVELARDYLDMTLPVVTGNSDQYVDTDLSRFYSTTDDSDNAGAILTMQDDNPKWSFASLGPDGYVDLVREKEVISRNATVGIYGFQTAGLMFECFDEMRAADDRVNGEFYVAPAFNYLIARGERVAALDLGPLASVMYGLGTPDDYEYFVKCEISRRINSPIWRRWAD